MMLRSHYSTNGPKLYTLTEFVEFSSILGWSSSWHHTKGSIRRLAQRAQKHPANIMFLNPVIPTIVLSDVLLPVSK